MIPIKRHDKRTYMYYGKFTNKETAIKTGKKYRKKNKKNRFLLTRASGQNYILWLTKRGKNY